MGKIINTDTNKNNEPQKFIKINLAELNELRKVVRYPYEFTRPIAITFILSNILSVVGTCIATLCLLGVIEFSLLSTLLPYIIAAFIIMSLASLCASFFITDNKQNAFKLFMKSTLIALTLSAFIGGILAGLTVLFSISFFIGFINSAIVVLFLVIAITFGIAYKIMESPDREKSAFYFTRGTDRFARKKVDHRYKKYCENKKEVTLFTHKNQETNVQAFDHLLSKYYNERLKPDESWVKYSEKFGFMPSEITFKGVLNPAADEIDQESIEELKMQLKRKFTFCNKENTRQQIQKNKEVLKFDNEVFNQVLDATFESAMTLYANKEFYGASLCVYGHSVYFTPYCLQVFAKINLYKIVEDVSTNTKTYLSKLTLAFIKESCKADKNKIPQVILGIILKFVSVESLDCINAENLAIQGPPTTTSAELGFLPQEPNLSKEEAEKRFISNNNQHNTGCMRGLR